MPTTAWLAAARKPAPAPIFIFQLPDVGAGGIQFASVDGHYPLGMVPGAPAPYHAGRIDLQRGGLPTVSRKIQNIFSGRTAVTYGDLTLLDGGEWDPFIGGYDASLRGETIHCWLTFPGLATTDAERYFTARIAQVTVADDGRMTLSLADATTLSLTAAKLAAGTYTGALLGEVVKARFTAAGLSFPADYDAAAWSRWTAAGEPGGAVVTGSWSEGDVFALVDRIIDGALTWYCVKRDGTLYIERYADLPPAPAVDLDLTGNDDLFAGGSLRLWGMTRRKVTVKYDGGAAAVSRTVAAGSVPPSYWAATAEDAAVDCGVVSAADAGYLADARIAFLAPERGLATVKADMRAMACDLGQTVKLDLGGKNLPGVATLYHRIVGIAEDPNAGEVVLTLLTKLGDTPPYV